MMDVGLCDLSQPSDTVAHKPIVSVASSSNDNYPCHDWPYVILLNILTYITGHSHPQIIKLIVLEMLTTCYKS